VKTNNQFDPEGVVNFSHSYHPAAHFMVMLSVKQRFSTINGLAACSRFYFVDIGCCEDDNLEIANEIAEQPGMHTRATAILKEELHALSKIFRLKRQGQLQPGYFSLKMCTLLNLLEDAICEDATILCVLSLNQSEELSQRSDACFTGTAPSNISIMFCSSDTSQMERKNACEDKSEERKFEENVVSNRCSTNKTIAQQKERIRAVSFDRHVITKSQGHNASGRKGAVPGRMGGQTRSDKWK